MKQHNHIVQLSLNEARQADCAACQSIDRAHMDEDYAELSIARLRWERRLRI